MLLRNVLDLGLFWLELPVAIFAWLFRLAKQEANRGF